MLHRFSTRSVLTTGANVSRRDSARRGALLERAATGPLTSPGRAFALLPGPLLVFWKPATSYWLTALPLCLRRGPTLRVGVIRRRIGEPVGVEAWRLRSRSGLRWILVRLAAAAGAGCGLSARATPTGDSATNAVTKHGRMMARFMTFPFLQLHSGHDGAPQPVHVNSTFAIGS